MNVSEKGLIEIAYHEAIVPYPYKDSAGIWTIGVGHTKYAGHPDPSKLTPGQEYPLDFCMNLFKKDIKKYEQRVDKAVTVEIEQHEFDALVAFDYNTGGIYKASLTKALNSGDRKANVAKLFLNWVKAGGRVSKGLVNRRRAEMRLFLNGTYSAKGWAVTYKADNKGRVLWNTGRKVRIDDIWDASGQIK
jgi:lysozyme